MLRSFNYYESQAHKKFPNNIVIIVVKYLSIQDVQFKMDNVILTTISAIRCVK